MKSSQILRLAAGKISAAILVLLIQRVCATPDGSHYTFSTTTTASLTDMSSGTTTLIGPDQDDVSTSDFVNIGFDFYFEAIRWTSFSVNSNGVLGLNFFGYTGSPYTPLGQSSLVIITACAANQRTSTTGKVHYKVIGSAPDRTLVVEWLNMQSSSASGGTADLTYQVHLHETTGIIEFVYGSMTMSAAGAGNSTSSNVQIGFSWNDVSAGASAGSVNAPQSGSPAPTYSVASTTAITNIYAAGPITVLDSSSNGSRRAFVFTPPVPSPPTNLVFSNVTNYSMTLSWTASPSSSTQRYWAFQSADNVNFYDPVPGWNGVPPVSVNSLNPSATYYFKIYAVSEGGVSSPALAGNQTTLPPGNISSTATGGSRNWSDPNTWIGGVVPTSGDNVTIVSGATVFSDGGGAHNLSVDGNLTFSDPPTGVNFLLSVGGDFTINSGGVVMNPFTQGSLDYLGIGGNLTNNGSLTLGRPTASSTRRGSVGLIFSGASNGTFGGSGTTNIIYSISIQKDGPSYVVQISPAALSSSLSVPAPGAFLTLTSGIARIAGTFNGSRLWFGTSTPQIPSGTEFWLDNPNSTATSLTTAMEIDGSVRVTQGTMNLGNLLTNNGTVTVDGAAPLLRFDRNNTAIGGTGAFVLSNGGKMEIVSGVAATNGQSHTIKGNGTLQIDSSASLTNNGTIAPGLSPGHLDYSGSLSLGSTSDFSLEIGGTTQGIDYDWLNKTDPGAQTLGGNLTLQLINGFMPANSDTFTVFSTQATLQGAFSNVSSGGRLNTADGFGSFKVTYNTANVTLSEFQSNVAAVSRKTHGGAGDFDVGLPLTGTSGIECRSGGGTSDYTIVATFPGNVAVDGNPQAEVTAGTATVGSGGVSNGGTVTINGNVVTIPLTNVTNAQTINVRLNAVNSFTNVIIPMSVLLGDTTANRTVNSSDIAQTQSQSGQPVSSSNFREDVTVSGAINSSDIAFVQSKSGTGLPPLQVSQESPVKASRIQRRVNK